MPYIFFRFVNRETTHPGITEYLKKGALSVRRSGRNFSRTAHDITLEQTGNKDSASKSKGISAYTDNPSGRIRYSLTRAARARAVSMLKEMTGMNQKEDGSKVGKIFLKINCFMKI